MVRLAPRANRWPPTFVVGAPRCGTTLVYLHLAGRFRFAWFPAAASRRARHPWAAARRALSREAWSASTRSEFGHASGELAPSDGWEILRRWFPEYGTITAANAAARLRELVTLVALFEELYGGPFLNKNNGNSVRIDALAAAFPGAHFVHVHRARPEAAASLTKARSHHGVALGEWWSAAPPAFAGRTFTSELEQVVATLVGIDHGIERSLVQLDPARWTSIAYEDFCAHPDRLVTWVRGAYRRHGVELAEDSAAAPASFAPSRLDDEERRRLEDLVSPLEARLAAELEDPSAG